LLGPHGDAIRRSLIDLKHEGKVDRLGVSVYAPEELGELWAKFPIDLVQAPFNVVDRRLLSSGWLARLQAAGIETHVRSVFLQGLLLMESDRRPRSFSRWQSLWDDWQHWLDHESVSAIRACLGFALAQPAISRVVVGVDSLQHLREILASVAGQTPSPPDELMSEDVNLINPSRWGTL